MIGTPRQGVHAIRIPLIDVAFFDVFCTIVAAYLLGKLLKINTIYIFIILNIIAQISHYACNIETKVQFFFSL